MCSWCSGRCSLLVVMVAVTNSVQAFAPEQAPFIRYPPRDLTVQPGGYIRLECYAMGNPYPNVTWYKDGMAINTRLKPYIKIFKNYTLIVKNPRHDGIRKDGGKYSCVAVNSAGSYKSENATVVVPYISDVFRRSPQDATKYQTKSHKFECIPPEGFPEPKVIAWKKDGTRLFRLSDDSVTRKIDEQWAVQRVGDVRYLSFWTTLESAGSYACVARNSVGTKVSQAARFRVKVIPPEVTMEKLTEKYVGQTAQLHCKIKVALPVPQREWSKVDGSMPAKSHYRETDDGKLIIYDVNESDTGIYVCLTKNSAGEMTVQGQLTVYKKPVYVIQPTSMKIPQGGTAKFECEAKYGKNIHIKYYYDTKWYTRSTPPDRGVHVDDRDQLIIPNVQLSTSTKLVRCFIADKFDSGTVETMDGGKHVTLTVINTDVAPPVLSIRATSKTVMEGDRLTLTCTATGAGNLKFAWYSADDNIQLHDKVTGLRIKTYPGGSNLTFASVMTSDSRAYRCKVAGEGGTQSAISIINVTPALGNAPGPVPYLHVRDLKSSSAKLVWGSPNTKTLSPVTGYTITIKNMQEGSKVETIQVGSQPTKKRLSGLKPSTVYVFSVAALNKFGEGQAVDSSNAETRPLQPASPQAAVGGSDKMDKLLDVILRVSALVLSADRKIEVNWKFFDNFEVVRSRITGYTIFYRRLEDEAFSKIEVTNPELTRYSITGLQRPIKYEIYMKAFNENYESPESNRFIADATKKASAYIPAPVKVGIVKKNEILIAHWAPPPDYDSIIGVKGYSISCLGQDGKPYEIGLVNKQAKMYILSGLDKWETYTLTIAIQTSQGLGQRSKPFKFVVGSMENGEAIGEPPSDSTLVSDKGTFESKILDVIKEPWFIGTIGTLVWLFLFVFVVLLCCRRARKRRQQRRFHDSARGLMATGGAALNGTDGSLIRDRWDNTLNTQVTSYPLTASQPPKRKKRGCCASNTDSMDDDFPNRADIKPLMMTYTPGRHESVEQRAKGPVCDLNLLKENNMAIAMKNGYMVDTPLNNELNLTHRNYDSGDDYSRLKSRTGALTQELTPSLHSDTGSRRDPMRGKSDSAERRHAEIVRTAANKSFPDAGPVNVMETNPQASWKRDKVARDSPKLPQKPPGENTLRRQAKSQFKPLPQLEVLNWHDGLPNPTEQSTNEESQVSAPSSPKLSSAASVFSDGGNQRPESRLSHTGSANSLNKYPFEKRRRKTSNASSMLSSELYQSEMDPSAYSDILSDRKKKKEKAIPPPIDLDGLTSDILLQWAESVTNSSPSSSGSSSPSRLSGISSEGSIYTDEDFAQAVAAVAECGGFNMDYDYSLPGMPGMPGTQPPYPSTRNAKMNKIDEVLQQRSKGRSNVGSSSTRAHEPHPALSGTPNTFIPQISMSSYLTGAPTKTPSSYSGQSGHLRSSSHRKRSNPTEKNLTRYGTGFQDVDSASTPVQIKPLTVSHLQEHDSSLGREKKEQAKPLTVSNLRQHDTSLDRAMKQKQNERLVRGSGVGGGGGGGVGSGGGNGVGAGEPPSYADLHPSTKGNNNNALLMPEAPLSVISALERNESINSNSRDSAHSSSRQDSEVENNSGTSERISNKKHPPPHVTNLGTNSPHC